MMLLLATVDSGVLVGAGVSVSLAGLALAWRLGGLERTVKDLQKDVHEMKGQVRDLTGGNHPA